MSGTINGAQMLDQMQTTLLQGVTMIGMLGCLGAVVLLTMAALTAGILKPARR